MSIVRYSSGSLTSADADAGNPLEFSAASNLGDKQIHVITIGLPTGLAQGSRKIFHWDGVGKIEEVISAFYIKAGNNVVGFDAIAHNDNTISIDPRDALNGGSRAILTFIVGRS